MYLPPGLTESEVFKTIEKVAYRLSRKYAFACFTIEDLEQQCFVWALERLPAYEPGRPLENFLQFSLKNKLNNLKREKLHRSEVPCKQCAAGTFCGAEGQPCPRHIEWTTSNQSKIDILCPVTLDIIEEENEKRLQCTDQKGKLEAEELSEKINERLPANLRPHYLRLIDGLSIGAFHRAKIREAVASLIGGQEND